MSPNNEPRGHALLPTPASGSAARVPGLRRSTTINTPILTARGINILADDNLQAMTQRPKSRSRFLSRSVVRCRMRFSELLRLCSPLRLTLARMASILASS